MSGPSPLLPTMPEIHENTIGNKLCQLFIEQQATADRTLDSIYTDVTDKEPCHCASPNVCPATQGHVHEILSNSPRLKTGVTGTEGNGLYPAMYSTTSMPVPVSRRGLVLQEAEIDARNYILKFLDNNRKECWIQVRGNTYYVVFPILLVCSFNPLHIPSSRYTPRKIGLGPFQKLARMYVSLNIVLLKSLLPN